MPSLPTGPDEAQKDVKSGASIEALDSELRAKLAEDTRRLVMLWVVVSGLWTTATLLRIGRVWMRGGQWDRILHEPWLWISLGVPPLVFALLLIYLRQIIGLRRRVGRR